MSSAASIATVTPIRRLGSPVRVPPGGARRSGSRRRTPGPVRLTRRGRVVVRLLALALALAAVSVGVLAIGRVAGASPAGSGPRTTRHVVLPGETLWSIAAAEAPGRDRRDVVARIIELNALPDGRVFAGQRLAIDQP